MAAFKQLREVSNNFEQQLRSISTELFSAKIDEPFEDVISQKLRDLNFLTSKLRLLKAKPLSALPQVTEQPKSDNTIKEYGELVQWKVLEQCIVKSLTQAHSVKALITTPDRDLDPELAERKENIIQSLKAYRTTESHLRELDSVLQEKEDELAAVQTLWDSELHELRTLRDGVDEDCDIQGPLYKKLRTLVDKLELMRWLIGRLVTSRGSCDWLAAPDRTARLLRLARTHNTVDAFLES
ncbi:unnamed protein product [Chrysodeixis includens]|uniref:Uncharacterized protein n=1 Tax=Chrysodeixis includens TaxID=689277 RepID=A0A9N8L6E7_CHRIL|nr:unnamed protein product [Chrysodeixis includens]